MVRPRQFDRQAALAVAMNEFWQCGYSGVSVKSLCEKLSITRSSFYNSFGSLDEVFEEAMNLYLSYNPMQELQDVNIPANEAIRNCFRALCRLRAKDKLHRGCLIINNLSESHAMPVATAQALEGKIKSSIKALESAVERAKAENVIDTAQSSHSLALCLQSLATGINTISTHIHSEKALWEVADTTLSGLGFE